MEQHDIIASLDNIGSVVRRLVAERNDAQHELCERLAEERTLASRSNGVRIQYTWMDIARERNYTGLLSPLQGAVE
jgi:hypothetical protein